MSAGPENGSSSPLGATPSPGGVNFSVFSRHATGVELLLFDDVDDDLMTARVVRLDPAANRTYHYCMRSYPTSAFQTETLPIGGG